MARPYSAALEKLDGGRYKTPSPLAMSALVRLVVNAIAPKAQATTSKKFCADSTQQVDVGDGGLTPIGYDVAEHHNLRPTLT